MKRLVYISVIVFTCALLTLGMIFALAQNSKVQTATVAVLTNELSRVFGTEMRVENVDYRFPNRLITTGIYISDKQGDTLLYADTLKAHFSLAGLFRKRICFSDIYIVHTYANLYETGVLKSDGIQEMNYDFLRVLFPQTDQNKTMQEIVSVNNVKIADFRLRYKDLLVNDLNVNLDLYHFSKDSLHAAINTFSFKDDKGFVLKDLQTEIFINKDEADIRKFRVVLPNSVISLNGSVNHNDLTSRQTDSLKLDALFFAQIFNIDRLETADVNLHIKEADMVLSDIGRFVPGVKRMRGKLSFTADVSGKLKDLMAENLTLSYKDRQILAGDVNFYGLPRLDTSYIHANLRDLSINKAVIQDFISDLRGRPYVLSENLTHLGDMHYRGIVDGRLDSLTLNGIFTSRLGNITTNGHLIAENEFQKLKFRGIVQSKRFNIGRLAGKKQLGNIAFRLQADAVSPEEAPLYAYLKGDIYSLQLLNYTYHNIHINGNYRKDEFRGNISVSDENISFNMNGLIDLTEELPIVNVETNIYKMCLGPLNLSERYADTDISAQITINASGNSADNLNGYIYVDSLLVNRPDKQLFMQRFRVMAQTGYNQPTSLQINSDFLNANIAGNYHYATLPLTFRRFIAQYMPRAIAAQELEEAVADGQLNQMEFYAYFKNLDHIADVFDLPVIMPQMPTVKGFIDEYTNRHALQMVIPKLVTGRQTIDNITLNLDDRNSQLNLALSAYKHATDNPAGAKMGDLKTLLQAVARNDSLYLDLSVENTDSARTVGMLRTATHFTQYARKPLIDCHILPTTIMIADSLWRINDSHLVYTVADTTLQVSDFRIGNERHFIYADGLASTRSTDSINIQLSDIVLDYLLEYTNVKRAITFGGSITGVGTAYSLFSQPMFEAEVWMEQAKINNELVGDAHATARLNREQKTIDIYGVITEHADTIAKVDGMVKPSERSWDLFIYPDSVSLAFINYWVSGFLNNISGRGFGSVHVFGVAKDIGVEGRVYAKDATIGIPFLGTVYHLNDSVILGLDNITFKNLTLHDDDGNPLYLNGIVKHDHFKNFNYEIEAKANKTLVMDLPVKPQDMFYGHIYATGDVSIKGNEQESRITANAKTERNSTFYFSTATTNTAKENNFITFVDHRVKLSNDKQVVEPLVKRGPKVYVDIQIDATPDLEVAIVIDPRTGDQLQGRGEGNLHFMYDVTADNVSLFGTYTLNSGTFQFTLQDLIRKHFTIREGSTVSFAGNPMDLQVDASAVYSTTASLRDLFGSEYSNVATNRSSVPVNCIIYLKDNILNPVISFGIELPQSDESVASQVKSIINTDEMMMREIIYLLVFNRFYTPEYLQNNTATGLSETYSLITSTVTGQINNWLQKLTNNFTVGFNIRADGFDQEVSQEYETEFQYTPNNRLIINGNFGYRYNDISNQPIFGNLDVEYLLTPSGILRAKAYTHTVDKYSLREAHTIQGVGLMFKYDFNGIHHHKKKKNNNNK